MHTTWPDSRTVRSTLAAGLVGAAVAVGQILLVRHVSEPTDFLPNVAFRIPLWKAAVWGGGIVAAITFPLAWARQLALRWK